MEDKMMNCILILYNAHLDMYAWERSYGESFCRNEKMENRTHPSSLLGMGGLYTAGNYVFKVNNRNTRTRCEICSKLTIKASFWCLYC